MKKVLSKILIILILLVMLSEFTCSGPVCYALECNAETVNKVTNIAGGIISFILWIPRILVIILCNTFLGIMTDGIVENCGINQAEIFKDTEEAVATPFDIFFDKYNVLSVDFFNIDNSKQNVINDIRASVAEWYYTMRTIAAAVLLCILIYVGIRMALSTVASDKAAYKKMLVDWISSLALIFVLQYIIIFTIEANRIIVEFLRDTTFSDMHSALENIADMSIKGCSIASLVSTIVYCMITFQTISFMIVYIQRMLKVGFLIIISPLISITYSIDKIGDGKAQALNAWLKEFVYTILIQPFHCILYLAFANTAIKLLNMTPTGVAASFMSMFSDSFNQLTNGFFVILCLKFINDGEKAIRKIFNFQDDGSLTSMAAGAALGIAAISNAKKIGAKTAKGLNMAKKIPGRIGTALGHDFAKGSAFREKMKDTKVGKLASKFSEKTEGLTNGLKNIKQGVGNAKKNISGAVGKFKETHKWAATAGKGLSAMAKAGNFAGKLTKKSMPIALGLMGAAMSYATGSSGVMEAIGAGTGLHSGSSEFFANTLGTLADQKADNNNKYGEAQYEREKVNKDNEIRKKSEENGLGEKMSGAKLAENAARVANLEAIMAAKDLVLGTPLGENNFVTQDMVDAQRKAKEKAAKDKEELIKELGGDQGNEAGEELYKMYQDREQFLTSEGKQEFLRSQVMTAENLSNISTKKHGKAEIESKKNEILAMLLVMQAKKQQDEKMGDNTQKNYFTDADMRSAEATLNAITNAVDRNIVGGGGTYNMSEMLMRQAGIEDDGSEQYQALMGFAMDYQDMAIAADAENIESNASSAGIEEEDLHRRAFSISKNTSR